MNIHNLMRRVRLVYKRSTTMTKVAVCAAIVLSTATLLVLRSATLDAQAKADALRQQAQQLEQDNSRLETQIGNLGSLEGVEQIAQDQLGLVNPDTVIIVPEN